MPVRHERFYDLDDVCCYDGIWACSSILHLPKGQLEQVLRRMERALRPNGVVYTSFKYGEFEGVRDGRRFTDFNEKSFRSLLCSHVFRWKGFGLPQAFVPGGDQTWLNVIIRKG